LLVCDLDIDPTTSTFSLSKSLPYFSKTKRILPYIYFMSERVNDKYVIPNLINSKWNIVPNDFGEETLH
jgi:hypothetical protein